MLLLVGVTNNTCTLRSAVKSSNLILEEFLVAVEVPILEGVGGAGRWERFCVSFKLNIKENIDFLLSVYQE